MDTGRKIDGSMEDRNQEDKNWITELMEGEDKKRLWRIGVFMDAVAIVLIPATMLFLNRFLTVCCLLCTLGCVSLCIAYPGYFSLLEDNKNRLERCGRESYFLILPYWVPVTIAAISIGMRYGVRNWGFVLLLSGGVTLIIGLILWFLIPELYRRRQHMIAAFGLALFVSVGLVLSVNFAFSERIPEHIKTVVEQSLPGAGKSGPSLTVVLPDGMSVRIPVHYSQQQAHAEGDTVWVDCYNGNMGIPFYSLTREG